MWRGMVGVALAAIAAAGADTVAAQSGSPAVRPEDAGVRALIASGMERSATFRDLNARLEKGDVIVYVRFSRCAGGVPACLLWAPAGAGRRHSSDQARQIRALTRRVDGVAGARASARKRGGVQTGDHRPGLLWEGIRINRLEARGWIRDGRGEGNLEAGGMRN